MKHVFATAHNRGVDIYLFLQVEVFILTCQDSLTTLQSQQVSPEKFPLKIAWLDNRKNGLWINLN